MVWTVESAAVEYCPACGTSLTTRRTGEGSRPHCEACDLTLYRNPVPMARATVVDGDCVLLIEMDEGRDRGSWATPGGHIDRAESPREAAARELEEETGLVTTPEALRLVGEGHLEFDDATSMVSFNYAVPRAQTSGTVEAGDDAAAARFWSREELQQTPPLVRAAGVSQLFEALDELGE